MSKYGVNTKIGSFCQQIQRTLFDKFSNPPFLFSEKITGCVIEPQFLAIVGTFCVDAGLGHSVSTINLNGSRFKTNFQFFCQNLDTRVGTENGSKLGSQNVKKYVTWI